MAKFFLTTDNFAINDTNLYFNLISPANSLELNVTNRDGLTYLSKDGFV